MTTNIKENILGEIICFLFIFFVFIIAIPLYKIKPEYSRKEIHIMLGNFYFIALLYFSEWYFACFGPFLFIGSHAPHQSGFPSQWPCTASPGSRKEVSGQVLIPYWRHCTRHVRALLYLLICADGASHQHPGQGRPMGGVLWPGQDVPVCRSHHSGCRGLEAPQVLFLTALPPVMNQRPAHNVASRLFFVVVITVCKKYPLKCC